MPQNRRDSSPSSKPELAAGEAAVLDVKDIFDGRQEVILVHAGERYRLRITSKGKLILTK